MSIAVDDPGDLHGLFAADSGAAAAAAAAAVHIDIARGRQEG